MYNTEQKNRYLNSPNFRFDENTRDVVESIFNKASRVEERENLDLIFFNRPQVVNLLKSFNSKSIGYLRLLVFYFDDYYNWCLSEGLIDGSSIQNYYSVQLVKSIIEEILPDRLYNDKYFTRDQIIEYLETPNIDDVTRFILYASFILINRKGIDDLLYLKMSDLDISNKTVKLKSGNIAKVDNVFIFLMKKADAAKFYGSGSDYTNNLSQNHIDVMYAPSPYVLKPCGRAPINRPLSAVRVRIRLMALQDRFNNKFINATNLRNSGITDYIVSKFEENGIDTQEIMRKVSARYVHKAEIEQYLEEINVDVSFNYVIKNIEATYKNR